MKSDLLALLPEACVSITLLVVLLLGARRAPWATRRFWLVGLSSVGLILGLVALCLAAPEHRALFSGMLAVDGPSHFFRGLFLAVGLSGVALCGLSAELDIERLGEYLVLLLSIVLGLMFLGAAQNLLMIYLALELVSVPSYVLAGFRRNDRQSSEAALKYVVYGGVASGLMLYGMSLLYGLTHSLALSDVAGFLLSGPAQLPAARLVTVMAFGMTLIGYGYKIAAVPFHMWCPDVYQGAPTPFVAFLSVAPKAGGMAALLRFLVVGFALDGSTPGAGSWPWASLLAIVSVATMTLGNLVAIPQNNVKRLLAYSSIAHAGYLLMGVAVGSGQAVRAVMFYLAVYFLMNFGAFAVVSILKDQAGAESVDDYRGLGSKSPVLAVALSIFLFSLTGLPPFAGFVGKFYLFAALLEARSPLFYGLALAGVLNSAVSLYFYARIVKAMYLEKPGDATVRLQVGAASTALVTAFAVPTLLLGVWWGPLATTVRRLATLLH